MKKSERPHASTREDGVDFISNMPDHILASILSRLSSTEEVIRTSILSTRWRYLWTSVPSVELLCPDDNGYSIEEEEIKINKFKEFVDWVLANRSVDLDSFSLSCFNHYSMSTIWRWIHAAIAKNVKQLNLVFWPDTEVVKIPYWLVTCRSLKVLKLSMSNFGLRLPNYMGFPSLRVLKLSYLDLLEDQDSVKGFLESCSLLEDLSLKYCLMYELHLLCISCPNLKKLKIKNDDVDRICGGCIKISCPKLVDLDLRGYIAYKFFFERLDSLKQAMIVPEGLPHLPESELIRNSIYRLFPGISHVESVHIDLHFFYQCIKTARDPSLPNLETLVLTTTTDDFTIHKLNQILKYCPKLESLNLIVKKVFDGMEFWNLDEAATRQILTPDHLKSVMFLEFNGEKPKIVIKKPKVYRDVHAYLNTLLKMVLSWGKKAM